MLHWLILALCVMTFASALAATMGPAPTGDPKAVSVRAIAAAKHPCPTVVRASRNPDGSVSAVCSNKEDYRIFSLDGQSIVMKCSEVRKLGVSGC